MRKLEVTTFPQVSKEIFEDVWDFAMAVFCKRMREREIFTGYYRDQLYDATVDAVIKCLGRLDFQRRGWKEYLIKTMKTNWWNVMLKSMTCARHMGKQVRIEHANQVKVYDNQEIVEGAEVREIIEKKVAKEMKFGEGNGYFDKLPRDWAITQQRMRGYLCRELVDEFGITHQAISLQEIAFLNTARGWFRGSQLNGTLTHA